MRTTSEIIDSIDSRLREVEQEIQTLSAARSALDGREPRTTQRRRSRVTRRAAAPQTNGADAEAPAEPPVEVTAEASVAVPSASGRKSRKPALRRATRK